MAYDLCCEERELVAARGVLTDREAAAAALAAHLEEGLTIMGAGCVGESECEACWIRTERRIGGRDWSAVQWMT